MCPVRPGRHPLPAPGITFAPTPVRRWGVRSGRLWSSPMTADTGAYAARLWWMLRWLGHPNVAVLDGGYQAWLAAGQVPSHRDLAACQRSAFFDATCQHPPGRLRTELQAPQGLGCWTRETGRVLTARRNPSTRSPGTFLAPVCAPFGANLDGATGRFRSSPADLQPAHCNTGRRSRQRLATAICYCGSGVTAAHIHILALVHAGYPEPALYPGSWSEWITDPTRTQSRRYESHAQGHDRLLT